VAFPLDCEAVTVSLRVGKPSEAARLVNAVVETYLEEFVLRTVARKRGQLEELNKLHNEYMDKVQTRRRRLADLTETLGSGDDKVLVMRQEHLFKEMSALQTELVGLQADLRKAQVELASYEAKEKEPPDVPPSALDEQVDKDPRVRQLKDRVTAVQLNLDQIRERSANPSSEATFLEAQKQLERARAALEARRKEVIPAAGKELQDKLRAENKARAAALRENIDRLKKLDKFLAVDVEERTNRVLDYARKITDLQSLRDEIRLTEETQKALSTEVEHLAAELAVSMRINLIDKAEVPGKE
jgi:chromosome segregation ATPase